MGAEVRLTGLPRTGGALTGPLQLPDGSAGTPSLTFTSDSDSGIYRVGADVYAVVLGGVPRVQFSATNADFACGPRPTTTNARDLGTAALRWKDLHFTGQLKWASAAANADTSGATLPQLETEVNEIKAVLRAAGLMT